MEQQQTNSTERHVKRMNNCCSCSNRLGRLAYSAWPIAGLGGGPIGLAKPPHGLDGCFARARPRWAAHLGLVLYTDAQPTRLLPGTLPTWLQRRAADARATRLKALRSSWLSAAH